MFTTFFPTVPSNSAAFDLPFSLFPPSSVVSLFELSHLSPSLSSLNLVVCLLTLVSSSHPRSSRSFSSFFLSNVFSRSSFLRSHGFPFFLNHNGHSASCSRLSSGSFYLLLQAERVDVRILCETFSTSILKGSRDNFCTSVSDRLSSL